MSVYEYVEPFMRLFRGLDIAFGTGRGEWVKRPPTKQDYLKHLLGEGPGLGIAPLMKDNRVWFASIDLDEPDFELAQQMQRFIPGASWVERSRSGNAHVHVFFAEPIEAWVAMGILSYATHGVNRPDVEVFPKNHDFAKVKFGNYINLPYHGSDRPVFDLACTQLLTLPDFIDVAESGRIEPRKWRQRCSLLQIEEPQERERREGKSAELHMCATWIIGRAISGEAPITEGHRSAVYFSLAKQLRNTEGYDDDTAWDLLKEANGASPEPMDGRELRRVFNNAGGFTSTGCDDPLVIPFTHPECPIAHGK
jgi:hypothetical protein